MSVNKRKGKYKTDKEFEEEQSKDSFVSKTTLKNQAQDLKKFGLELTKLKKSVLEKLPVGEVALKSLLDFEKMTTNLARKRHLMFIGKCLRNESESNIREFLESRNRESISDMQQNANMANGDEKLNNIPLKKTNDRDKKIDSLINANSEAVEMFLEKNSRLERQSLKQYLRNCNSAKNDNKKQLAKNKLIDYLKLNKATDFN